MQAGIALPDAGHDVVQLPQWLAEDTRLAQVPPQFVSGGVHAAAQAPDAHTWPDGHAVPHEPQCAGAVMSASQPSADDVSQSAHPAWQLAMTHAPAEHAASAWARAHGAQEPQPYAGSFVDTHTPEQSVVPAGQAGGGGQAAEPLLVEDAELAELADDAELEELVDEAAVEELADDVELDELVDDAAVDELVDEAAVEELADDVEVAELDDAAVVVLDEAALLELLATLPPAPPVPPPAAPVEVPDAVLEIPQDEEASAPPVPELLVEAAPPEPPSTVEVHAASNARAEVMN